ncbi:MAG TPA: phage holin family protein [Mollicutes bacterium]|jgi:putative membrane protein|nr:phage holin family protein [Mollicutes bacterium]
MKIVIIKNQSKRLNSFIDWLIHMFGYALVLIAVSLIFKKTIYIDDSYFGFWGLVSAILIYVLNKTIKPILVWLTLPITGLTLGLFYPFINVFILNIVDFILGSHFEIGGILMSFVVAICISIMNLLMSALIIEPILRRNS